MGLEIDALFITAILTVMGFSIHDTIVVLDRLREKLKAPAKDKTFEELTNEAVNETFARSINTSLTACLSLLALVIFGAESIRGFNLALLIGIAVGTYSSIFIASPILVDWYIAAHKKANK
jgi:preprotein translocase SecF subunit